MFETEKIIIEDVTIHLLKYTTFPLNKYMHLLNEEEMRRFHSFNSSKRQFEFLATRILKEQLFPNTTISYNKDGAPFIKGVPHISISHSENCSAIATSTSHVLGLDIEPLSAKAKRLASKFLNDKEQQLLDLEDETLMVQAWSCKEALLKLTRRKGILFKRDLLIHAHKGSSFHCSIFKNEQEYFVDLASIVKDNRVITINKNNPILR